MIWMLIFGAIVILLAIIAVALLFGRNQAKTWAKVGIGCLVVLVFCCIISIVAGIYTGVGGKIKSIFGGLGGAKQMATDVKAIQNLDTQYPFTAPENGNVEESRLQAYVAVATGIKTAMEPYEGWIKTHQNHEKGNWKDVKEALTMSAAYVGAMRKGLDEQKMSPKEYHWIAAKMKEAEEEGGAGPSEAQKQMVDGSVQVLQQQMDQPGTTPEAKAQLQGQIDKLKATLAEGSGAEASPNRQLYLKYASELKACDLKEFRDIRVE